MEVRLLTNTPWALETLLYTKNTRLQGAQTLDDIIAWPEEKKLEHLAYMKDTIQSSWEFVDYIFEISGVTRAFTHQLVRNRTGSYAQESQRTVDVSNSEVINTIQKHEIGHESYNNYADSAMARYQLLIARGVPVQDARGLLPTNVSTSIIAKFNLRSLHDMGMLRLCTRTQGEFQRVFKAMLAEVVKRHPWAEDFIKVYCAWTGTCCFPRYTECPVQKFTITSTRGFNIMLDEIEEAWENTQHEAVPIAKDGMSM